MQKEVTEEISEVKASQVFAVIIANPTSGSYARHATRLQETIAFLQQHSWHATLRLTEAAGDGRRLAREAVTQKADIVIAAGGDGTINEVIQELAGTETALGVLPIGTVNDWAREIGIPLDEHGAREILVHGRTRRIDLGRVNEHYFLLMVGIGLDGEITQKVEQHPLKRFGVAGYLLASTWYGLRYQSFVTSVISGEHEEKTSALQIVIGNTQLYGGAIKFTWRAKGDDGLLDAVIVRKRGPLGRLLVAMEFLLRRKERTQWISYQTSETIEIQTPTPVAMQIDGEPIGYTPARFHAVPAALKVVVPPRTREGLFSQE
ncbi:MAG: diacylglycerol/lipid kinase family protein [Ktedonobacteraceae bacterium]